MEQRVHGCLAMEAGAPRMLHVLADRGAILRQLLVGGSGGAVLKLHLHVRDRPQPELPLGQRSRGEEVLLHREAAATDAHLLAAGGALSYQDLEEERLAALVLVDDELAMVVLLRMELAVQNRGSEHVVVVQQVPGHEATSRGKDRLQRLAHDVELREERLRDQAHGPRDVYHPSGALLLSLAVVPAQRADAEVEAGALREEGHLEALEVREVDALRCRRLELAVPHQGEGRQREGVLLVLVRERKAVDVEGE
mmetsp:Transcript_52214/g.154111  ORF Transcript_52214/g.154111 Transcript_52214/m.154111 type:complete len:253 (+) Transcript_52214:271-1029(+)